MGWSLELTQCQEPGKQQKDLIMVPLIPGQGVGSDLSCVITSDYYVADAGLSCISNDAPDLR